MDMGELSAPVALVVEDEALLALEAELLLSTEGFTTILAFTAASVETLAPNDLTVAVVDLCLGGELAGHQVIQSLRRRAPNLPVVVMTGYHGSDPQADLRGLGGPTIRLRKPVQQEDLLSAVRTVISRARAGAEPQSGRRQGERHAA